MRGWTAAAGAFVMAIAVACGPADDTEEMVRAALAQANLDEVDVSADEGIVRLSGTVDTLADRTRAVELASVLVGDTARVDNQIAVSGLGPAGGDGRGPQPDPDDTRP